MQQLQINLITSNLPQITQTYNLLKIHKTAHAYRELTVTEKLSRTGSRLTAAHVVIGLSALSSAPSRVAWGNRDRKQARGTGVSLHPVVPFITTHTWSLHPVVPFVPHI